LPRPRAERARKKAKANEAEANKTAPEAEASATKWAQRAAIAVLVLGTVLIVVPAVLHLGEAWKNPFEPSTTVTTVVTKSPGKAETKRTTAEASRSFVERSLASGGLLLVRIGLVALAAFLAGAVVQRTMLGVFTMKLGPLEVPELAKRTAEASDEALEKIKAELGRQADATKNAMGLAAGTAEQLAYVISALKGLGVDPEGGDLEGKRDSRPETPGEGNENLELELQLEEPTKRKEEAEPKE
jgi:hypothetical protein